MADEQRLIRFYGNVQGVGFRYTTCRLAGGFDVVGYVRNMPDGSVECLVEASPDEIDAFVAAVGERMRGCIRRQEQQTAPASGAYRSFGLEF
ncbi:MAG: acylphosphatase [Phycisphaerae bacterium]